MSIIGLGQDLRFRVSSREVFQGCDL